MVASGRIAGLAYNASALLPTRPYAATAETTDLNEVERQTIGHVMRETRGTSHGPRSGSGSHATQLYGRLRKYGIDTADT